MIGLTFVWTNIVFNVMAFMPLALWMQVKKLQIVIGASITLLYSTAFG